MTSPVLAQPEQQPSPIEGAAPLTPATNVTLAEQAAELLSERYFLPAQGRRYAAALRENAARGDYAGYHKHQALAERMTMDLQAVAPDAHLRLYPTRPAAGEPGNAVAPRRPAGMVAPGIEAISWVEPGIAFIAFDHFNDGPEAMAAIRRFLVDYRSARTLVIDARNHRGGAFDMMGVLSNHLFAQPRLLANMDMAASVVRQHGAPFPIDGAIMRRTDGPEGMVRFQHWAMPAPDGDAWQAIPVYYLTSGRTFSAAEHMAMVLRSTGRGILVGEATGGGNHFGGTEPVGDGMEMYVPVGRTSDPATGLDWEGVGITPHVAVPAEDALAAALRIINASPGDPPAS